MGVWAVVPVKPLNRAKSRLADALSPTQREQLATALLMRTVGVLLPLPTIQSVLVISRDQKALAMVRELGALTVQESSSSELNLALLRATHVLKTKLVNAALIVPADIPLLMPEDVEAVVQLGRYHQSVVIVPDRHETGTNMLLVRPPNLIPYVFGKTSFAEHQRLAEEAGASLAVHRSQRVALDVDTLDDLQQYYHLAKIFGEPPLIEPAV